MKNLFTLLCLAVAIGCATMAHGQGMSAANPVELSQKLNEASILFVENRGQIVGPDGEARPDILFSAKGQGCKVFVTSTGLSYQFLRVENEETKNDDKHFGMKEHKAGKASTHRMEMKLLGANENVVVRSEKQTEYIENFFNVAAAPEGITGVRSFERIVLEEVYPGIDWIVYSNDKGIKYDFILKPSANPDLIRMDYAFAEGMKLNRDGSLTISCSLGEVTEDAPVCFQGGKEVKGKFVLRGNVVSVKMEGYDATKELVIDPSVVWSTYYGGNSVDGGRAIAKDGIGNVFMAGYTESSNGIAFGGHDNIGTTNGTFDNADGFLVKFGPNGNRLWATYYGGTGSEMINAVATDPFGNVYIAGVTNSATGIASGGHQNSYSGGNDGFFAKFSATGSRIWASYYGGNGLDQIRGIAVSSLGKVYITGSTNSPNTGNVIATPGAHQTTTSNQSAFIAKFNTNGFRNWGTFYGDNSDGNAICLDAAENVIVAGSAGVSNQIVYNFSNNINQGGSDAFVVKIPPSGGHPMWGRYFGGPSYDAFTAVATDASNNILLGGETYSQTGISFGNVPSTLGGGLDGILVKLQATGSLLWARYYGGENYKKIWSICIDQLANVYVAGMTHSMTGVAFNGFQNNRSPDAGLVSKFGSDGTLLWGSYLNHVHVVTGICRTLDGSLYVDGEIDDFSGFSSGSNIHQPGLGGAHDAFLTKINDCTLSAQINPSSPVTYCTGSTTTLTAIATNPAGAVSYLWTGGGTSSTMIATTPGTYNVTITDAVGCTAQASVNVIVLPIPVAVAGNNGPLCEGTTLNLTSNLGGGTHSWTGPNGFTSTLQNPSIANVTAAASGNYTMTITNPNGCSATATTNVVVNPLPIATASHDPVCGDGDTLFLHASGGTSYSWTGPNGFTSTLQNPTLLNFTNINVGTYTGTVTGANGCLATASTNVIINPLPVATATLINPGCGNAFTLGASGGTSYSWSGPYGFTSNLQNPGVYNPVSSGSGLYTVVVSDSYGCSSAANVNVPYVGYFIAYLIVSDFCEGGTINLSAGTFGGSGATFSWSGPNGFTYQSTTSSINIPGATALNAGNYQVTVTSANGCSASGTDNAHLLHTSASNNGPFCQEGQTLQLTANYSCGVQPGQYWTGPNGFTSTVNNPTLQNFDASMAGTYTVWFFNGYSQSGCSASTIVNYFPSPLPEITANYCAGNGTIQLTSTSGFASYQWNTGTTGNPITVTQAGTYTVTVTNSNGCTSTAQINIQLPGNSVGGNLVANGDFEMGNAGFITNYILQGNGAFQQGKFAVTTNAGTPYGPNFTGVDHTTGNGKWMMVNGATALNKTVWQQSIPVNPNSAYNFSAWLTNMGTQNDPQILIFINGSPITGLLTLPNGPNNWQQYSASWNAAGNTTATIRIVNNRLENSGNDFGIDDISFTNANPVFASVGLNILSTNPTCSNLNDGSANLTVTGGIPPYSYAWSNGATTEDVSNLAPGTYIATVTDNAGCTTTASVTINTGPAFVPTASNSGNVCAGGSLSLNASNGASYNWSGPNNFSSTDQNPIISNFQGAAYGTYFVTVTNTAGCIGTATTAVTPTCPAQALNFDGVDDLVNINTSLGNFGTGDFTVEMNVRTTRTGEYIIAKRPSCNFGNFWNVLIIGNGKVGIELGQGPGNFNYTTLTSVSSVVDGQWHHIALSRNGTLISLYIDGVLENSANPSFVANLNNTAVLRLGYSPCTNVNGSLVYQGDMDEIRIWNRALCLGELQNNQNCTLGGLQTALLAQYSFNQGIAFGNNPTETSLMDNGGNGNHGSLQSFGLSGNTSNWVTPGVGNGAPCSAFVLPVIVAGSNSPVCGGTDLNLTATGGTSYQWSGPNGFTSTLQNPTLNNFSAAMVGTYAVTVTSGSGCAGTATVTVAGDAVVPTITCPANITVNCEPGLCGATVSYAMATAATIAPISPWCGLWDLQAAPSSRVGATSSHLKPPMAWAMQAIVKWEST